MMTRYVCGLYMAAPETPGMYERRIAMVEKMHGPACLRGLWTGIGGKVNPEEKISSAMIREFAEETNTAGDITNWELFCTLSGMNVDRSKWEVFFFFREGPWFGLPRVNDVNERLQWRENMDDVYPNIRWLVPMARSFDPGKPFRIIESGAPRT